MQRCGFFSERQRKTSNFYEKSRITHKFNGLLSKDSSAEHYYNVLVEYMDMPDDNEMKMRNNCVESFAPYDIKQTAKQYELAYKD